MIAVRLCFIFQWKTNIEAFWVLGWINQSNTFEQVHISNNLIYNFNDKKEQALTVYWCSKAQEPPDNHALLFDQAS